MRKIFAALTVFMCGHAYAQTAPITASKQTIQTTITANGVGAITGPVLQAALNTFFPIFYSMGTFSPTGVYTPNIPNGTVTSAMLQSGAFTISPPSTTQLGGVFAATGAVHQYQTGVTTSGAPTFAQPGFSDLSGVVSIAQVPSSVVTSSLGYTPYNSLNPLELTNGLNASYNLYTAPPANGFYANGTGALFSYYPIVGGNPFDNTRASTYIPFTSTADAGYFESGLVVNSHIVTGVAPPWTSGVATTVGQSVLGANANVYTAQNWATTGATIPSCSSGTCSDGAVTWLFRQNNAYYGKAGTAFYTVAGPGASGAAWGVYENYQTAAGSNVTASFAHEIDTQNNDIGCTVGVRSCYALFIGGAANLAMTAAISLSPQGNNNAYHFGILLNGAHAADTVGIDEDTDAPVGLAFNYLGVGTTHATSTIQDNSTSPASFQIRGTHNLAAIFDQSTSGTGIALNGTYAANQISGTGWNVTTTGALHTTGYSVGATAGVTVSGTSCTIKAITGGIITSATCP